MTLPDPNIVANGPWYAGSPYLGGEAMVRAVGSTPIPPSGTVDFQLLRGASDAEMAATPNPTNLIRSIPAEEELHLS